MEECKISISKCNSFDKEQNKASDVHIEIVDENGIIIFSGYMTHENYGRLIIGRGYALIERDL